MTKRCKAAFAASVGGVPRVLRPGALVPDNDPVLKGRENLFEDVEEFLKRKAPSVEDATSEPGARRSLTRPKKQTAARKPAAKKAAAKAEAVPKPDSTGDGQEPEETPAEATEQGDTEGKGDA